MLYFIRTWIKWSWNSMSISRLVDRHKKVSWKCNIVIRNYEEMQKGIVINPSRFRWLKRTIICSQFTESPTNIWRLVVYNGKYACIMHTIMNMGVMICLQYLLDKQVTYARYFDWAQTINGLRSGTKLNVLFLIYYFYELNITIAL